MTSRPAAVATSASFRPPSNTEQPPRRLPHAERRGRSRFVPEADVPTGIELIARKPILYTRIACEPITSRNRRVRGEHVMKAHPDHRPSVELLESTHLFPGVYTIKAIGRSEDEFERARRRRRGLPPRGGVRPGLLGADDAGGPTRRPDAGCQRADRRAGPVDLRGDPRHRGAYAALLIHGDRADRFARSESGRRRLGSRHRCRFQKSRGACMMRTRAREQVSRSTPLISCPRR